MRALAVIVPYVAVLAPAAGVARAQPETRGSHDVETWDAGDVDAAGASIPLLVYHPGDLSEPLPTVIVMHGYLRNGSYHEEMASTFASRGFVALVPDMPCGAGGCDHDANAEQLSALFDWAIAQSADGSTPIAGLVDAGALGLVGHSWGGLGVHLATARDDRVRAVVLLDPNDDGTVGLDAASEVAVPNLALYAAVPGSCNSAWDPDGFFARTAAPKLHVTVARSGHCDPEDPGDSLCAFACGAGDEDTTPIFRRYTIAWMGCFLAGDGAMADWIGGASYDADVSASVLTGPASEGLDEVTCGAPAPRSDAGPRPPVDAGPRPPMDGAVTPGTDAGATAGDASTPTPSGGDEGGCGCTAPGARSAAGAFVLAPFLLAVALRLRRRGL